MKFTYNWLKQYVDFDWSAQELAERLTFAGIEVEDVVNVGGGPALDAVVVCQILSSEKHPNADKLSICRVTDGTGERQIVCGAKNYKVGDKVPLALPGVTLPNGLTIKPAQLRGVESQGMMCSAKELALAEDAEGLLILPAETAVGIKLNEALGGADAVFDIEVTPNRPDWLSIIGIAREVSAMTGNPLRLPEFSTTEGAEKTEELASALHGARDSRGEDWAEPGVAEAGIGKSWDALHQQRGGRDQLRVIGVRASVARLRLQLARRPSHHRASRPERRVVCRH